ncbi:MAG: phosphate-binding protein [Firmicutes bacterium HGW-Firmicutes-14]|nr:MAG: phosphate-binding protein [Firmicutes bacterium HGW-Firmicutes-14]
MLIFRGSKIALLLVVIMVAAIASTGCGGEKDSGTGLSGTVKIAGSTSVQPLGEELAEAFMDQYPDVNVNVQGGGSSAGIETAKTGTADIGTTSRELKDEEKGYGLTETIVAKDGIAIVTNNENKVTDLTMEQVAKIFSGDIKNWKEVGSQDGPITVVVREEGSGTRGAFEEIVLGNAKIIDTAIVQNATGAVKTAVTKDVNAIGFISLGSIDSAVKTITVDGSEPSEENVINGSYKISRPFIFLTANEPSEATEEFIKFVLSNEGQDIVSEEYIRVNN